VFAGPASAVVPSGAVPGLEIGTNYDVRLAAVSASPSDMGAPAEIPPRPSPG